ncbi:hypothetical protein [Nitrosospira briensis]|uniref:hypothetical protein n=1 Tax=Nitrosospira briensis TaxID=35799 RepID=UPI000469071A|nr:hypothetical protein [Nitrosospira briensis]
MNPLKIFLFLVPALAGCASTAGDHEPVRTEDGSSVYSLTSLYDGNPESRQRAAEWLDIDAKNLCLSEYTLISEESVPTFNQIGAVISSRLVWKIKCQGTGEEPPSRAVAH